MVCHRFAEDGCYKPKTVEGYDYIQDFEVFEGWKKDNSYTTVLSDVQTPPIVYSFKARTDTLDNKENYAIEKRSIILRKDKDNYFKVTNIEKGIKKLSFKWRKWRGDDKSAQIQIIVGDTVIETLKTSDNTTVVQTFVIDVPAELREAKSFEIKPTVGSARIIIDDIMWSNNR